MQLNVSSSAITSKPAAVLFGLAAIFAAGVYPLGGVLLASLLVPYAALLIWRPVLWLALVPALLPIFDLAPWTGWFYLEELDLLLMVTAAVLYWRLGNVPRTGGLAPLVAWSFGLLGIAYLIGTGIGLGTTLAVDLNSFTNYFSRFNSLRVAKGFFWSIVLLPLLMRSAGPELSNIRRYFVPGMLAGLGLVCIAAVWERMTFPGLLNMSSDYRITAPFSAMHTGGAALDGYLALAMPFVAAWLVTGVSRIKLASALVLLVLGAYVGLTTFSRGVYLAYGVMALLFLGMAGVRGIRTGSLSLSRTATVLAVLAVIGFTLTTVFTGSGYRGLGAGLVLLAAAFFMSTQPWRIKQAAMSLPLAALLCGLGAFASYAHADGAYLSIFKGVYGTFVISALAFAVGALLLLTGAAGRQAIGTVISLTAFVWMAFNTGMVALHWGGDQALGGILLLIDAALAVVFVNRIPHRRLWQLDGVSIRFTLICCIAAALVIPMSGSYYMSERFSTVQGDFAYRWAHWTEAVDMMTPDLRTSVFGMGIGRYPDTYFWNNKAHEVPATHRYEQEQNNRFLRLGTPVYAAGFGEVVRMLQRVPVTPDTAYRFSVNVRRDEKKPAIDVQICKRLLLYPEECVVVPVRLVASDGQWHHYEAAFNSRSLGAGSWLFRAPTQLQISIYGSKTFMDIDNVSLMEPGSSTQFIRNGGFSDTNEGWFFSSDRHHLPWHIKNFILNVFFELGWFGVACFVLLLGTVMSRLCKASIAGTIHAKIHLAAIMGFLSVGLFDSLLDVPRLALLFFLMLAVSMIEPLAGKKRRRRHFSRAAALATTT